MGKAKVTELKNVDVGFVSFVTEGANGQKFQIFKSKGFKAHPRMPKRDEQRKARYSMRELIENVVRGMFNDSRVPPKSDNASDSNTNVEKETPMNEVMQAIASMRDEIVSAILGLRTPSAAPATPPEPGTSNGLPVADVTFSKETADAGAKADPAQTPAPNATPASNDSQSAQPQAADPTSSTMAPVASATGKSAQTDASEAQLHEPGAVITPAQPQVPAPAESSMIAELTGMVAALAKQVESLTGKVESISKQRSMSNAIPDNPAATNRKPVEKTANGQMIPDFSNIFA